MSTTVSYKGNTIATAENQTKTLKTAGKYMEADVVVTDVTQGGSGDSGSASSKQINFIDYDGTIVESYTKSEWQNVTALPDNPSHSGLTAQGWNWTKAQIDAQLIAIPDGDVWVGQMYITDDGKTKVYIHLAEERKSPMLGVCPKGTVDVDWGDGTAHDTLTGTSLTTIKWTSNHQYSKGGDYVITLTVTGSMAIVGVNATNNYCRLLHHTSSADGRNQYYIDAIKRVEIGSNTNIGNYAFYNCYTLTSITMSDSVTSIGTSAFQGCYSLTNIIIPDGVTRIGTYAFYNCYSLANITIPNSVTSIEAYAFYNCYSLVNITIPNSVTSIAFSHCYSLTNITIPDGVTSIGNNAFFCCHSLTNITIPDDVTSIGSNAFSYCYSLTNITIPDDVTSIGTSAFSRCYSLANITIPNSVTSIEAYAFAYDYGMTEYHFLPLTPPTLANINAFNYIPSDCIIYVPSESLEAYQTATNWSTYASYMRGE